MTTSARTSRIGPKIDFSEPLSTSVLRNQSILVTGGASGLGLGAALALAKAGAYVTIADISTSAGQEIEQYAQCNSLHVQFVYTDVTSYASQLAAVKATIAFSPNKTLDIVIPCAGNQAELILPVAFPEALPPGTDLPEPSVKTFDVHLKGTYYSTVLALHYFKATREQNELIRSHYSENHHTATKAWPRPHLLLVSSSAGFQSLPLSPTYTAVKWAARGIFRSLREFPHKLGNARINLVAPWFITTPMTGPIEEKLKEAGMRFGTIEDFVEGVLRLCCNEDISGRAVAVNPSAPADTGSGLKAQGEQGSGNFDICDDEEGFDGAREYGIRWHKGLFFETEEVVSPAKVWGYDD